MSRNSVTIDKGGRLINIDEEKISTGDLVVVQAGEIVPADIRLLEAEGLEVDEFKLTGELLPVGKKAEKEKDLILRGSRVVRGYGKGKAIAIGSDTEYGKILKSHIQSNAPGKIILIKKKYFWLIAILSPLLWRNPTETGAYLSNLLFFLSFSIILILLQNNDLYKYYLSKWIAGKFGKKMGYLIAPDLLLKIYDVNYFCFDKTGVLTSRQIDVKELFFPENNSTISSLIEDNPLFSATKKALVLCNDVFYLEKIGTSNPIDRAMFRFAERNKVDVSEIFSIHTRILEEPFDSEKRFMSAGFKSFDGSNHFFIKGDPEVVLPKCNHYLSSNGERKNIDFQIRAGIDRKLSDIFQNGNTAIAIAYTDENPGKTTKKFALLCIVEFQSPLHPDSRSIIKRIQREKKRALLLTGDRHETALSVALMSGIADDPNEYLTGKMISKMSLSEVSIQSKFCSVFARLKPSQKGVLIRLFQQQGHKVMMIGDGANDGIALRVADIGVSFFHNSSPIARNVAGILVNDLGEIKTIIDTAKRTRLLLSQLKIVRVGLIALMLLSVYCFLLL
jgi:Ca2+-transporting ATPase